MVERLKTPILKIGGRQKRSVGSNPTPSAKHAMVGEWLKPTDCKSVPLKARWFESIPLH